MLGLRGCAGFSLVAASGGSSLVAVLRLLNVVAFLVLQLNSCGVWALVVLSYMGSPWIRDQIRVSCIGGRILYHWATREATVIKEIICGKICVWGDAGKRRCLNVDVSWVILSVCHHHAVLPQRWVSDLRLVFLCVHIRSLAFQNIQTCLNLLMKMNITF